MSSYAVAPMPIAATYAEAYDVATPNTWQPVRIEAGFEVQYGGFEVEGEFTAEQLAEIESMGGRVFASPTEYLAWREGYL